jgi:hypothetical protein
LNLAAGTVFMRKLYYNCGDFSSQKNWPYLIMAAGGPTCLTAGRVSAIRFVAGRRFRNRDDFEQ